MALYDVTSGLLAPVEPTSFVTEKVLERKHLQVALRANVSLLPADLMVLSEEFGEFAEANRRIDLLCLDRSGRLVVVELKRTEDAGHVELQALRYAAMVSTMTMADVESALRRHLKSIGEDPDDAEQRLIDWLSDVDMTETPVPTRDVRIVLVAQGFDKQITSTVLWLNDIYGLDIRCVRLIP